MITIVPFNKALKYVQCGYESTWTKVAKGKWIIIVFFWCWARKFEGQTVHAFKGNLDIKDSKKLANNLSPFLKETLEIWSELNYQGPIETSHRAYGIILWLELWTNRLCMKVRRYQWEILLWIKSWLSTFLSPTEIESKYHTKVCPMTLHGITSTLRELWKNKKKNRSIYH